MSKRDKKIVRRTGNTGFSLVGLTFLALLILKLTGLADITWFWVFFPLWILPAVVLTLPPIIFLLVLAGASVLDMYTEWKRTRRHQKK